jgi:hypothetical protein
MPPRQCSRVNARQPRQNILTQLEDLQKEACGPNMGCEQEVK